MLVVRHDNSSSNGFHMMRRGRGQNVREGGARAAKGAAGGEKGEIEEYG